MTDGPTRRPAPRRPAPRPGFRFPAGGVGRAQCGVTGVHSDGVGRAEGAVRGVAAVFEFHVAAAVRRKYRLSDAFFRTDGNVVFADYRAVREFAARMNAAREPGTPPVRAGELNAMGLIDEILHFIFRRYETQINPGVLRRAVRSLESSAGQTAFRSTLAAFAAAFPPMPVYRGEESSGGWLSRHTGGRPHPEVALEEMLLLHLANRNPAFARFRELFDDSALASGTAYTAVMGGLRTFLAGEKPVGEGRGGSILDLLEEPMRAAPDSLAGQLGYIRDRWGIMLSDEFRLKVLGAEDLTREDARARPGGGAGPALPPDYAALASGEFASYPEPENFTHDTDWMPNVILLAKNAFVWLHQLSRAHGRRISRLDEVPDEELDRLARWNFTSLWLIGVWHRSEASARIKQMTGNPEAAPSAYSLHEYEISPDLGGEEAFGSLSHRAWQRGIRLAADMVPNHTGIVSRWMRERPDFFVQSDHPPFPSYRFTGPDLSDDPDYQVRIEDGYWTRSDAAVVFQRIENGTGRLRYIYHGNDGTNMPWNDTAQLDFLRADVREAVIGQILHVARKFSVIRFDAAMTLTKKHFQRLWYPQPGTGGDIPSRADHAMTREEFDVRVPEEFWREVVDRINREMPQTLLLAEAFWLLEGFFVRTLGMHRVYNSAFMHMLMKEDNAMYRGAIRSTLHFNPEILKRYVNFMSNPDEKTAVEQFGKGDKYFCTATLLTTLPGLPMFAHGQVEGYREKYGMEYRRDYHDELPDDALVARHEREIFPLLRLRRLFSQTDRFELYDVTGPGGGVAEDVFAYSNMAGGERALVCCNNRYEASSGTIRVSCGKLAGGSIQARTLADALELGREDGLFHLFREHRSGLEFVRTGAELHDGGFHVRLDGYQTQVFLDFRQVRDADGSWARLHAELGGAGVRDAARAARAIGLRPFAEAFGALFEPSLLDELAGYLTARSAGRAAVRDEIARRLARAAGAAGVDGNGTSGALAGRIKGLREFFRALEDSEGPGALGLRPAGAAPRETLGVILGTFAVAALFGGREAADPSVPERVFDEFLLEEALRDGFGRIGSDAERNAREAALVRCLATAPAASGPAAGTGGPASARQRTGPRAADPGRAGGATDAGQETTGRKTAGRESAEPETGGRLAALIGGAFAGPGAGRLLGLNEHEGAVYFHRESFAELLTHMLLLEARRRGADHGYRGAGWDEAVRALGRAGRALLEAAEREGYRTRPFLEYVQSDEFRTLTAEA